MAEPLLTVERLAVRHGGITAAQDVSFAIMPGESVALLGANGAGKSSVMRAIAGLDRPTAGRILLDGRPAPASPRARALAGIGYAPEGRRPFPGLTVRENLEVAGSGARDAIDRAFALFPPLAARATSLGWQLSGGEAQMLAIARALMLSPRLLLLDEPTLGLAPRIVAEMTAGLRTIAAAGTALLIAEEKPGTALALSHRAIVMRRGQVVDAAPASEMSSQRIHLMYFGL